MVMFNFDALDQKYRFSTNSVQNIKIVCWSCKFVQRHFKSAQFDADVYLFCFILEIPGINKNSNPVQVI